MSGAHRGPQPSLARRVADGVAGTLLDIVGEAVPAIVSCLLFVGAIAGIKWGWDRHPVATVIATAIAGGILGLGGWTVVRPGLKRKGVFAAIAAGLFIVVAVWLSYVVSYCSCIGVAGS